MKGMMERPTTLEGGGARERARRGTRQKEARRGSKRRMGG